MSSNYFGGSQGENFSSSPEVSVSENTDKPVESDKKTGSSISDNMEKNSENGLENPDKYIGDSTPDEVDESQNDDWDDIDKYLGDGTGRKESNGNSYGEYVVEVTYLADSNEDEQETHDMMEMAYSETSSPENMHELKERIEERSENIEVVDAQVISKPEISDSPERIEKSVEPPVEEQTEAIESPTGIPEPRAEMPDKPNDTKEMDDEVPESSNEALDSNEVSESIQTDEKSEMNGETAYALSFETASNAEELNKRFEDEFYKQGKYDKKEIGSIQADTTRLLNEIETQKSSLDKAIQSTHEEIYEYVTEGNMSRFETERDSHYISMIEKYKAYQSQREKLDYYSTKLDDNNSRLAEITGKSGEEALADVDNRKGKIGFFSKFFNSHSSPAVESFDEAEYQETIKESENGEENNNIENALNTEETTVEETYEEHMLKDIDEKVAISDRNSDELDWEGEIGDSLRVPKDPEGELVAELRKYDVDGIEYKDGNVDFSPVALYEVEFKDQDELYDSIGRGIPIGRLETRQDLNNAIRDKWQSLAKQQVVERINEDEAFASELSEKTGIDVSKVTSESALKSELSRLGLTMHETPDCSKIQFVLTKIHDAYKHSGGTSEMLERQLSADIRERVERKRN